MEGNPGATKAGLTRKARAAIAWIVGADVGYYSGSICLIGDRSDLVAALIEAKLAAYRRTLARQCGHFSP
jgi:hypothetical protein